LQLIKNITDNEKSSETPIINYSTEELAIRDTWFSAIPIEYPATSNERVVYIFNINPSDCNALFNNIQYSMEGGGGSNKINCPYLNCYVKKVVRKCTGVKICEYTKNEIKNLSHCE
ncbi:6073_t:CDS:2, partial [Dentiscutata erythropus]